MGTIVHTQGQGNRPREKIFIVEREEYPLICLLDHLLYLAVYDDVLVSLKLRTVDNVFDTIVPPRKNSLQLKIKRELFVPAPGFVTCNGSAAAAAWGGRSRNIAQDEA
ncbi:MAG: hypothetical protein Q9166_002306 [cf. Caloplaca sp. 2 TL-2023]